ncbi:hypothetical protein EJB05_56289, partial [Eragrostis curvula]
MILHGLSLIIGVLLNVQACIQYFVWIEYSLLDGITYTVSSWFLKWRTWPNESSDKALDVYRLTLLKFVDQSIKQLDCLLYVSTSWAMGLVIGPAIGGYLAQETLHTHESGKQRDQENESLTEHLATDSVEFDEQQISLTTKRNLFTNWPLMSSITLYCIACFDDMAYSEIFPIWAESDRSYGGLSMSSEDVGQVLAITGASILLYQTFLYPHKVKALGPINASRVTAVNFIHDSSFYFPTNGTSLKVIAVNSLTIVFSAESKFYSYYCHILCHSSEQLCDSISKRGCKWLSKHFDVLFQGTGSSRGRYN